MSFTLTPILSIRNDCFVVCFDSQKGDSSHDQRNLPEREFDCNHGPKWRWQKYAAQCSLGIQTERREWSCLCQWQNPWFEWVFQLDSLSISRKAETNSLAFADEFKKSTSYITQDDSLQLLLTVIENMEIAANLKLGNSVNADEKSRRVSVCAGGRPHRLIWF